ncbi:GTP 3',8-cyclase MoaA [Ureibacillus sinduriensis]|uniref:GTP 3',8-cyclase n=1 Tax=Ureibacillus sinduriensis BLB-1 = JCM 15800 TaxID=1384057 RepID=A0A0A3I798_9BACL|nr:GTP 3',8-cyclase MoaA [Ureibacillus sinduriensis]KGR78603.1 molybdenum cofactor biosynthesis protein A [Ureibacillus sinduriensis BLB-1 = JCM 15800]
MVVKDTLCRPLRDLRISVMDQCNLRCTYCMPKEIFGGDYPFLPPEKLLNFQEIKRLVGIFSSIGVKKIRITGGEPLLRKDLPRLIAAINKMEGIDDVALTTNGILLGQYAEQLKSAGLKRINVSLDSLDPTNYGKMNGRNFPVARVLKSIERASTIGLQVKINMVVQKGVNDGDIIPLAKYCFEKGYTLRFIEFMDVGNTNGWDMAKVVPSKDILNMLQQTNILEPVDPDYIGEVAKRYRYQNSDIEIGFISSITESFCSSCNRARISADGKLFTCLFATEGTDLLHLVRSDKVSENQLAHFITDLWNRRNDHYSEQRSELSNRPSENKIEMSYIGG